MDPITLAAVTAALTVLAGECAKGFAGEAGKTLWAQVKSWLGWHTEPPPEDVAVKIAQRLQHDAPLAQRIVDLLQQNRQAGTASHLVQNLSAQKVIVADKVEVHGDLKM